MAVQKSRQPTGPTQEDYSMPKTIKELKAEVLRLLKENAEVRKLQKRFSRKLSFFVEELRSACISSDLIYWDDTVVFIHTARACFRFYGNDRIALYSTHMKKDLAGILVVN